ncbi:MAG: serine/threonine-protein phosphatase [Lachnospiraceae bacterium]|nr:serine/threonine-protein phosphatase [Lachnospiraceae bacterium]
MIGKKEIQYYVKTDRGLCRDINQDAAAALAREDLGLFVLSDGMGGHSRGELASSWIVKGFEAFWENLITAKLPSFRELVEQVQKHFLLLNGQILQRYNQGQICGATAVVLLISGSCYAVFSVGDSRIYTSVGGKSSLLTVDDVWDTLPSTVSAFTPEQILLHENHGKLVQAVGIQPWLNVHISTDRLKRGQVFLLCSDGLFKCCDEEWIQKKLRKVRDESSLRRTLEAYFEEVYRQGAGDNVTAILAKVR